MLHGMWNRHKRHMADGRIFADDEDKIGMIDVRQWMQRSGAEHRFAASEFVCAILRSGAEVFAHSQLLQEPAKCGAKQ